MTSKRKALLIVATVSIGILPQSSCVADQVLETILLSFRIASVWF